MKANSSQINFVFILVRSVMMAPIENYIAMLTIWQHTTASIEASFSYPLENAFQALTECLDLTREL